MTVQKCFFQMALPILRIPCPCAAALKNIEIMEREEIFAHVRDITPHFQARLQELRRHDIVGDTRGMACLAVLRVWPHQTAVRQKAGGGQGVWLSA